jgi:hypothetical protein
MTTDMTIAVMTPGWDHQHEVSKDLAETFTSHRVYSTQATHHLWETPDETHFLLEPKRGCSLDWIVGTYFTHSGEAVWGYTLNQETGKATLEVWAAEIRATSSK